ncbi:SDR family oxidoreductase [Amycolatopsis sp. H20-H5]|uniref:SDR family oxidoreductase n=1 Tax=Amycolatopsis sp. H20-H5 TaxID=3046309 RepID=UPI002DBD7121|nr:SDR family oxidoreductase [Amycolatopsis sp. H20-H5]MEC3974513.1 SDR family oxidoreductase [Amycolatopsis sp. H20-H5]
MNTEPGREFAGRVVLVTGGARGLGAQISRAFVARGAHVVVNYFHASTDAPRLLASLNEVGSAELLRGSVANRPQVDALFETIRQRHGGLDVLVNNAAAGALLPLDELDESHWQRAFDTNLRGSLWCSRAAAKLMAGRQDAAIVNLSSVGSSLVISDYATVGTSKAAVEALTRYLAVEFAPAGIRVNTASGGLLDGKVATKFPRADELAERVREATPLGHRLGSEAELAELVVFLASGSASWITGQTIVADGGLSLGSLMLSPPAAPHQVARVTKVNEVTAVPGTTEQDDDGAVAVIGMGVVAPGANNPDELWSMLSGPGHVFGEPVLFDIESFHAVDPAEEDRAYARESGFITAFEPHPRLLAELREGEVPSRESTTMWLRHSLYTALETVTTRKTDRFFAALGYTADGSQELEERLVLSGYLARLGTAGEQIAHDLRARYDRLGGAAHEYFPHRVGRNAIRGLLPDDTELLMVDTACSSALYSVDLGLKTLLDGDADVAVCGGAFAYSARNLVLFSKLQGLSRSGEVRSFDRDANGVLFSDGAGVVVLKRLRRAREDGDHVLGVIEAVGLSCDGRGKAIYAPNAAGQALALRRAYLKSGTDPESVDWVIAHATGTQAGDSTELASLREVAAAGPPALLSSNKPIVGHTGWTAGLISLIQALQGLRHGYVPAQRYLRNPIAALADSRFTTPLAPTPLRAGRPRRVAVSSFGFGGTNAHLLLTDAPTGPAGERRRPTSTEDIVVVGWAADLPGDPGQATVERWLRQQAPAPAVTFGDHYPLPQFGEVRLPPATLRNMDRGQIMLLRAAARLDERVRAACDTLNDTTGIVVGHMGPTRRAVHYALRCYLGDLQRFLGDQLAPEIRKLCESVRALVPPSTEDAFPGIMPNIIPARLAAQANYHGLNVTVDTGPDSGLDALRTAERYLRHHDLDMALVAGVNGNSTPELADVLAGNGDTRSLAEGAFLTVLTRESTAAEHGLPVLARIRTEWVDNDLSAAPAGTSPLTGSDRTYLGADPILALLGHLANASDGRIGSIRARGPHIHITAGKAAAPAVDRMTYALSAAVPRTVREEIPAIPEGALVLVSDPALLERVKMPASTTALAPRRLPAGSALPEPAVLEEWFADVPAEVRHVRVFADLGASITAPEDLTVADRLRVLHDLAYLAARRWTGTAGSSFAVLALDALRDGAPHPASGLFTGLAKSLAKENPDALSYAVLTTDKDVPTALGTLTAESRHPLDLHVVVHDGPRRSEYTLTPAPHAPSTANLPLGPDSVVVAAGGSRGLTAELLEALAQTARPNVYVLGRQAPGDSAAPIAKAEFIAAGKRARPERTVAALSAEHTAKREAAAVRATIDRLARHCGPHRVHHLVCDLTDPDAVTSAIERIHARHERVDLLINAAGLHHGGTVRATSLQVARQVRDTKLLSYLNLRAAFASRPPRLWHNFGSLLAVLGWPGEAAYCSANDFLNAAGAWRHSPGGEAETTLAWALWDEAGFASEPLTRDLLRSIGDLTGLSTEDGRRIYLAELTASQGSVVTYLGAGERRLLDRARVRPWLGVSAGCPAWVPDDVRDGYLAHHLLKGTPTLPAALIIELAVQAAASASPGRTAVAVRNANFFFPVTAPPGHTRVYRFRLGDEPLRPDVPVQVFSDLSTSGGVVFRRDLFNAEVTITLTTDRPHPPSAPVPSSDGRTTVPVYYSPDSSIVLSGPFASLAEVRITPTLATARFSPRLENWAAIFSTLTTPALLVDALLQLSLLATSAVSPSDGEPAVPVGIEHLELFTELDDVRLLDRHEDRIVLSADPASGVAIAQAPDGTMLARVRGITSNARASTTNRNARLERR